MPRLTNSQFEALGGWEGMKAAQASIRERKEREEQKRLFIVRTGFRLALVAGIVTLTFIVKCLIF